MIPASKYQKQRIAILTKGDKEWKASLVFNETLDANKTSTNNLSYKQANNIIQELGGKPILYDNWAYFDKAKATHRKILSYAIQYGWYKTDKTYGQIADLYRLSEWLKTKAPVKKKLSKMTPQETNKIITALENMIGGKYK